MSPLTGRWDAVPEAAPWGPCTRAARCAEGATVHSVTTPSVQRSSVQFARSQQVPRPPSSPPRSCKPAQSPRKAVEIAAVCSKTLTAMGRRRCPGIGGSLASSFHSFNRGVTFAHVRNGVLVATRELVIRGVSAGIVGAPCLVFRHAGGWNLSRRSSSPWINVDLCRGVNGHVASFRGALV